MKHFQALALCGSVLVKVVFNSHSVHHNLPDEGMRFNKTRRIWVCSQGFTLSSTESQHRSAEASLESEAETPRSLIWFMFMSHICCCSRKCETVTDLISRLHSDWLVISCILDVLDVLPRTQRKQTLTSLFPVSSSTMSTPLLNRLHINALQPILEMQTVAVSGCFLGWIINMLNGMMKNNHWVKCLQ